MKRPSLHILAALRSPRRNLSLKLSMGILLMAMPIFMLSMGVLYVQTRYFMRREAAELLTNALNTMLHRVHGFMGTVETAVESNVWYMEEYFCPDSLLLASHRIVRLNPNVSACTVCTTPGPLGSKDAGGFFSVYSTTQADSVVTIREDGYDYSGEEWYAAPLAKGTHCWVDPFDADDDATQNLIEAIATYCRPLRLADGRVAGVVTADMSLHTLAVTFFDKEKVSNDELMPYPNAYFMLIDGAGRYLIHPDTTRLFRKTIFSDATSGDIERATLHTGLIALGHEMTAGHRGSMNVSVDGALCHVCYAPVEGTSWSLALVCPDGDILKSYRYLSYLIIALIIVGLAVIVWLCQRVVRNAIMPLHRLLVTTRLIADGNYEVFVHTTKREDAVGRLQNSFAKMIQSLYFHMGSIRYAADQTRERNEQLTEAARLAEEGLRQKNLFIQNVSHQIRTPLNILTGFAQVLGDDFAERAKNVGSDAVGILSDEELASLTAMMRHNAHHLDRMVRMLYDSSASGTSATMGMLLDDRVGCNALAREVVAYTESHFPGITIAFSTTLSDDVALLTNRLTLMRTIREMLYNAAKYSDGQHIRLSITTTTYSAPVTTEETDDATAKTKEGDDSATKTGEGDSVSKRNFVRFIFEDTGPGIDTALHTQIFAPFTKVNDLSEGLGLGLSLSRSHARALGGCLTLDTEYKRGCRFLLDLPL